MAEALRTIRIQQALTTLGLYAGPIDGQPNDQLTASITTLQGQLGVPPTGVWDDATDAAAGDRLGTASRAVNDATKSIQRALTDLGFYDGPIDGRLSAATTEAIRAMQAELGVAQTGIVDAATLQAIYDRGVASVPQPPPTTTTTTTTAPTTTTPATVAPTSATPTTPQPETTPQPQTTPQPETTPEPETTPKPSTTPKPPDTTVPADADIADALTGDPRFSQYVSLLTAAGWSGSVGTLAPITVFAPTNAALDALPADQLAELRADPETLARLLRSTVVAGNVTSVDLRTATSLTTLAGTQLAVSNGGAQVGGATLGGSEITADNGVIHPVSAITLPSGG